MAGDSRKREEVFTITDVERRYALRELRNGRRSRRCGDRRKTPRYDLDGTEPIVIELHRQNGTASRMLAKPHNMGVLGLAFLNGTIVPLGARCVVHLADLEGREVGVPGKVVHCHIVCGRVQEVGVEFDSALEVANFVHETAPGRARLQPAGDCA